MTRASLLAGVAGLVVATSLLAGCANYDYLAQTDRVGYRAGNAVAANLEAETINPSGPWIYDTSGLGKNGSVIPAPAPGQAGSAPAGTTDTQPLP